MEQSNSLGGARIALLIDFDNVILGIDDPGFDVELVVNALRERGTIVVSRVYGDWYRHNRHRRKLMEHGLELVEAPAFGPVIKNSADIKIALDGYEIGMTQPHINTFCLVSGDSDFLPLIKKLQGLGKNVLVICGNRFTSDMLRRNCNEFISYENLLAASYGADEDATTIEGAFALLHRAMEALRERGSEIRTSTLKQMMIQLNPVFSEKTFGYSQFRGFLDKAGREGLIKLGPRDRVSGEFYVLLPEEDEAEVIDKVERAEPAEVVGKIVEARGTRRGRGSNAENGDRETGETRNGETRNGETRNGEARNRRRDDGRKPLRSEPAESAETEAQSPRPRSRREARIAATQTNAAQTEAQSPREEAAPLATPLTPATDFSPADSQESQEMSISRRELLARGLRRGRFAFSGKTGRVAPVETPGEPTENATEEAPIQPDIAFTPDNASPDTAPDALTQETTPETAPTSELLSPKAVTQAAPALETPEGSTEATLEPEVAEKPKRTRSRRRKKTAEAPEPKAAAVAQSTEAAAPEASAPANEASAEPAAEVSAPEEAEVAEPKQEKPKRTRRRKKTEETPEAAAMPAETDASEVEAQAESNAESAPAASAEPPAEEKPKRRRRTSRKKAEEAVQAEAQNSENIVTTNQTTGEVTQKELAQIPVPTSEDEV